MKAGRADTQGLPACREYASSTDVLEAILTFKDRRRESHFLHTGEDVRADLKNLSPVVLPPKEVG